MSIDNDKRIFAIIRPSCVTLSQIALAPQEQINTQSLELINALKDVFQNLDSSINPHDIISSNLTDYIFVPLSYLLKLPDLSDTSITYILKIITILIRNSWSANLPYALARQLFPLITYLTGGSPNPKDDTEIKGKSDELKLSGATALQQFFNSLVNQKNKKEYDFFSNVENLPALGHVVTVLLNFTEKSPSCVELQAQSLSTLSTLYFDLINDGEVLSYILPGNVSTLTKVLASRGQRTHYTVLVQTIDLLGKLLLLVYNDEDLGITYQDIQTIQEALQEDQEFDHIQLKDASFQKVHRTRSWLRGTSTQVKMALGNLVVLQDHAKWEVKESLLKFCESVLGECLYSLGTSIPVMVKLMANLSNSLPVSGTFIKTCKNKDYLQEILSSELNNFVDGFSATIQSPNQDKINMNINSIQFLCELGNTNEVVISKLVETTIIELNDMLVKKSKQSANLISESDTITDLMVVMKDMNHLSLNPKALSTYDNVLDASVQLKLARMFQSLGEQIDPSNIINSILIDDIDKTLNERGISLWIVNNLMQGYTTKLQPDLLFDEFLDFQEDSNGTQALAHETPEFTFVILDYCKSLIEEISGLEASKSTEQVSCIALDTIGVVANLMKTEFEMELVDYLYPVIDSLASHSEVIRNHALNSALIISDNLYGGSLNQLVVQNTDYLIDAISVRLSNALTSRSTAILAVCTKLVGYQVVQNFKDVIEITFSLLDYYHGYEDLCLDFFVLFEIIIDEVKREYLSDASKLKIEDFNSQSSFNPWGMKNIDQLINLLDKSQRDIDIVLEKPGYEETINRVQELDSDDEEEEEVLTAEQNQADQEDSKELEDEITKWVSPIPQETYKLLQQMAAYGERLLTHPSVKLELQILRTMKKVIVLFATQPRNLLPIVANLWPIITNLIVNEDPKIVMAACDVLILIIEHSGSFISQRFVQFWRSSMKGHHLFQTTSKLSSLSTKQINLPGLNLKCFQKLSAVIRVALKVLGKSIPDITASEMIETCSPLINDEEIDSFGDFSDIAWMVKFEKYGAPAVGLNEVDMKKEDVVINGISYRFVELVK
ncbi:hypothetical protein WICPIJ_009923 [Wickerhamomyces pijperi]|uniref:TEL2-interacting protein 1 n=1 Tax=Wickerhamomyces pijperi TaxID=599730 RepID=A0A9P8PJ55_WICPI|nr:hypothetical protein WICPIJ_009923 [Wickerhamomyces pijperi]